MRSSHIKNYCKLLSKAFLSILFFLTSFASFKLLELSVLDIHPSLLCIRHLQSMNCSFFKLLLTRHRAWFLQVFLSHGLPSSAMNVLRLSRILCSPETLLVFVIAGDGVELECVSVKTVNTIGGVEAKIKNKKKVINSHFKPWKSPVFLYSQLGWRNSRYLFVATLKSKDLWRMYHVLLL